MALAGPVPRAAAAEASAAAAPRPVTLSAHRCGTGAETPGPGLDSCRAAIAAGVTDLEADWQQTSDLVGVIYHHLQISKTLCDSHPGATVTDLSWTELSTISCADMPGGIVHPLLRPDDLYRLVQANPRVTLRIELKAPNTNAAMSALVAQLKAAGVLRQSIVQSFCWDRLSTAAKRAAGGPIRVSALDYGWKGPGIEKVECQKDLQSFEPIARIKLAKSLGVYDYSFDARANTWSTNRQATLAGLIPVVWTVNTPAEVRLATTLGSRITITNHPTMTGPGLKATGPGIVDRASDVSNRWLDIKPNVRLKTVTLKGAAQTTATVSPSRLNVPGDPTPGSPAQLMWADLGIKVSSKKGKGYLSVGPRNSDLVASTRTKLRKGTHTYMVAAEVGDLGGVRVFVGAGPKTEKHAVRIDLRGYHKAVA